MIYLPEKELEQFKKKLTESIEQNTLTYFIAETLLGEQAIPEDIMEVKASIDSVQVPDNLLEYYQEHEDGPSVISTALGISKRHAQDAIADSRSASMCLRALRDKYEDIYFQSRRARAEQRGFFATVLYTIKKAIYWIIKQFRDLKDDFMDLIKERPMYSSRAKRDYLWIRDRHDDYLAANTNWFLDNEY